jgi:hypothetical protein
MASGMNMAANKPATADGGHIAVARNYLNVNLDDLRGRISRLEERIGPVLSPVSRLSQATDEGKADPRSEMANYLFSVGDALLGEIKRLEEICDRVDL